MAFRAFQRIHKQERCFPSFHCLAERIYHSLRHDASIIGHGWSVGQQISSAVGSMTMRERTVVISANQSVSAASLQLWIQRYADEIFYYPLPTGGPLYQLFPKRANHIPTRRIERAAKLDKPTRLRHKPLLA